MSEQLFTKEQMFACWLKSAEKGKMKGERLDKDYERSCFERWLPSFKQIEKEPVGYTSMKFESGIWTCNYCGEQSHCSCIF